MIIKQTSCKGHRTARKFHPPWSVAEVAQTKYPKPQQGLRVVATKLPGWNKNLILRKQKN